MTYSDPLVTLHVGDALDVLAEMEPESVHCVVTSPPYWGLRKYEGDTGRVWGDRECGHEWSASTATVPNMNPSGASTLTGGRESWAGASGTTGSDTCLRCSAWRGSFGLEPLHDCLGWARGERCNVCYVCHSLAFLDAIRRVVRSDGVVFWNLGDSYAGSSGNGGKTEKQSTNAGSFHDGGVRAGPGLKPKDMVLIPQRIALAAQSAEWWVRSDIIWAKPNPMPESVTDRPTSSYEHVLLFTKSARYYWDAEAVREPAEWQRWGEQTIGKPYRGISPVDMDSLDDRRANGRNLRDVWDIATRPYPEAHFATFPEAIPDRAIRAATSEHGGCGRCGAPWARVVERSPMEIDRTNNHPPELRTRTSGTMVKPPESKTLGFRPTCAHDAPVVPATVLDPFAGSGTTLAVAKRLGRRAVGIEISAEYAELARRRIEGETARLL